MALTVVRPVRPLFRLNVMVQPHMSEVASLSPSHNTLSDAGDESMQAVLRMALERLQVGAPQDAVVAPESASFRRVRPSSSFTVPPLQSI